ncbi:MAG: hypothetical protein O7D32_11425, partial [bacterium]|nr:hypothetical protein [bacterium]
MSLIVCFEATDKLHESDPQELIRDRPEYEITGAVDSDGVIQVDCLKNQGNKEGHWIRRNWARRIASSSVLSAVVFLSWAVVPTSAQSRSDPPSTQNISQRRELDLPFDRYDLQSWTTKDGLPSNSVSDIVQTRDGYLWLATFGGLARFDGVRFEIFDLSNTDALPSNRILSLLEDRSGNLWIGTQGGGVVRLRDGVFTSCSGEENAPSGSVWSIIEDREGVIWFGARNLVRYRDGRFESFGPDEWMTRVKQVWSLHVDREQSLWVATDNGLGRFRDGQWRVFRVADGLSQNGVHFLHEDSRGLLWASTATRLNYWDGGKFVEPLAQGEQPGWIFVTTVDSDGNDLVGSGKGLFLQRAVRESGDDSSVRIHFERSIERSVTENVRALLEDREGNLWVGTDGLGLLRLREAAFTSIPVPPGENITVSIQSLADDGAGGLWIQYSGKIGHLKDDEWKELSVDNDVRAIGGIWSGSHGTLWIKHQMGKRLSKYQDGQYSHLAQEFVHIDSVLVDRQGTVWISWAGGLST